MQPPARAGVNEASEVSLHALVDTFSLPVGLWMISRAHTESSFGQLKQLLLEMACEYPVPIRNYVRRHAMETINMIQEQFSNLRSREGMKKWNKVRKLAEFINHHQQTIG